MNAPEPQPSADHAELAVTGMGLSLLVVMISGPVALFAPWRTAFLTACAAIFVFTWSFTMLLSQYMASMRHDGFAAKVISLQWTCNSLFALTGLLWYAGTTIAQHGFDLAQLGFTFMGLVVVVVGCLIFAGGNWRWRSVLLEAEHEGMQAPPWQQLTIVDIMAATLVIAIVMGTFSFLLRK